MDELADFLWKIASPLVGTSIVFLTWLLLSRLSRYSIRLYARRSIQADGGYLYRFVVQNAETVPIVDTTEIRLEIKDKQGKFVDEARLISGPIARDTTMKFDESNQELQIRCRELRPLDTWAILCRTNSHANQVRLVARALDEQGQPRRLLQFSPNQLLAFQKSSSDTQTHRPDWRLWLLTSILACLFYSFTIWFDKWVPAIDLPILFAIVLLSGLLFMANRRQQRPIVQGYLGWEFGEHSYRVSVNATDTDAPTTGPAVPGTNP